MKVTAASVFRTPDHRYVVGDIELPGVTRILSLVGITDFSAPWFTPAVQARGQLVHETIALFNAEDLIEETLDPVLVPYLDGYRSFLHDTGAEVEFSEQIVGGLELGYAGTLDLIVRTTEPSGRVRRTVLDIKPAVYPGVGPQTAAYQQGAFALYEKPVVLNRGVLLLPGDGSYAVEPLTDSTDKYVFEAALRIVQFRHRHGGLKSWAA